MHIKKMFINMNVMLKLLLKRCKYTGKNEKQLFLWVFVTMIILVLSSIANDDLVNIHLWILSRSVQILLVFLNEASDHYQE